MAAENPTSSRFRLDNRNAIVTGGSTGIGREVVLGLIELGAKVTFNSTENSAEQARSLLDLVSSSGGEALWVPGDVKSPETISNLVGATRDKFGPPTIVVCAAGVTRDGAFLRMSDESFDGVYAVKATSARRLSQATLRYMSKEGFGRFAFIGSVSGDGSFWQVNYAMANEALIGLAKSIMLGYADKNVTAHVVKPALTESKLTQPPLLLGEPRNKIIAEMPIGRILQPVEVADAILMLVAQRTAAVNGHVLYVDGGMRRI